MTKILLVLVFIITLAVPLFNRAAPALFGFPFFYWYQLAIVPVSSLLIYLAYLADRKAQTNEAGDK